MHSSGNGSSPSIPILFEDNHLLVVEKPVNIPTQEDDSGDPDMLRLLKQDLKMRANKPGNVFLGLVHRLDRPVGGVMVFAKTSKAASKLSESIRNRTFQKTYLAVIHGHPELSTGRLHDYLAKDSASNTVSVVSSDVDQAKEAVLEYEITGTNKERDLSLVRINLLTGRSHQIRVQFAHIGCPLYGDQKYGQTASGKHKTRNQLALWSAKLSFEHPTLLHIVTFQSFPPKTAPWNQWEMSKNTEIWGSSNE